MSESEYILETRDLTNEFKGSRRMGHIAQGIIFVVYVCWLSAAVSSASWAG